MVDLLAQLDTFCTALVVQYDKLEFRRSHTVTNLAKAMASGDKALEEGLAPYVPDIEAKLDAVTTDIFSVYDLRTQYLAVVDLAAAGKQTAAVQQLRDADALACRLGFTTPPDFPKYVDMIIELEPAITRDLESRAARLEARLKAQSSEAVTQGFNRLTGRLLLAGVILGAGVFAALSLTGVALYQNSRHYTVPAAQPSADAPIIPASTTDALVGGQLGVSPGDTTAVSPATPVPPAVVPTPLPVASPTALISSVYGELGVAFMPKSVTTGDYTAFVQAIKDRVTWEGGPSKLEKLLRGSTAHFVQVQDWSNQVGLYSSSGNQVATISTDESTIDALAEIARGFRNADLIMPHDVYQKAINNPDFVAALGTVKVLYQGGKSVSTSSSGAELKNSLSGIVNQGEAVYFSPATGKIRVQSVNVSDFGTTAKLQAEPVNLNAALAMLYK